MKHQIDAVTGQKINYIVINNIFAIYVFLISFPPTFLASVFFASFSPPLHLIGPFQSTSHQYLLRAFLYSNRLS